jgi:hypothetical protein
MRSHGSLSGTIRALLLLCCFFPASINCFAKLTTRPDYRNGILDAELVIIVLQHSPGGFRVGEVFLGNANTGDSIELPGFRLFTEQRYGPDIVEPITADTRVLLFLHHKKDAPAGWEPTYFGYSFFWVQDPTQLIQLERTAEQAVALRRRWEEAANISDLRRRRKPCGHFFL